MNNPKYYWLYVLELEQGKYYIGRTSRRNPQDRIDEHFNGFYTAQWVKKYKPVKCLEIVDLGLKNDQEIVECEDQKTLLLMKEHGYNNVRGGRFSYGGKYRRIGSRYFTDKDFEVLSYVVFTLVIFGLLLLTL